MSANESPKEPEAENKQSSEELDKEIKAAFDKLNFMRSEFDTAWKKSSWSQGAERGRKRQEEERQKEEQQEKDKQNKKS